MYTYLNYWMGSHPISLSIGGVKSREKNYELLEESIQYLGESEGRDKYKLAIPSDIRWPPIQ